MNGIVTDYDPDEATGAVAAATDAHGHVTGYTLDWGVVKDTITPRYRIERSINPDGTVQAEKRRNFTTTFEDHALGRVRWVRPPAGHWTENVYDNTTGRSMTSRRSGDGRTVWTRTETDGFGRVIDTENSAGVKTTTRYDALGRKRYESLPVRRRGERRHDVHVRRAQPAPDRADLGRSDDELHVLRRD